MASPPPGQYTFSPTALSPPYPSHTQLPHTNAATTPSSATVRKRQSIPDGGGGTPPPPSLKRRKASTMSVTSATSAHPLRQTSFPPEDAFPGGGGMRSPSVDADAMSIVSGSQASGVGSAILGGGGGPPLKKKRGRKSKAEKAAARELEREQTPSVAGGRAGTVVSSGGRAADARSNAGTQAGGGAAEQEQEEEEDGDVVHMSVQSAGRSEAQTAEEKKLRAMLARCLDADQFERFSNWRAAKLPDPVVRRVVNATVSQSVPNQIVTAVRTVTKFYLCDIIRLAREVQAEWIEAGGEVQAEKEDGEPIEWPGRVMSAEEEAAAVADGSLPGAGWSGSAAGSFTDPSAGMSGSTLSGGGGRYEEMDREKREVILREPPRGPLRPEHLREALRRYQATAQSQGIGSLKFWHEQQRTGVERFPVRTGGRRIFR